MEYIFTQIHIHTYIYIPSYSSGIYHQNLSSARFKMLRFKKDHKTCEDSVKNKYHRHRKMSKIILLFPFAHETPGLCNYPVDTSHALIVQKLTCHACRWCVPLHWYVLSNNGKFLTCVIPREVATLCRVFQFLWSG